MFSTIKHKYVLIVISLMTVALYLPSVLTNDFVGYWDDYGMLDHFFVTQDFSGQSLWNNFSFTYTLNEARKASDQGLVYAWHGIFAPITFLEIKIIVNFFGNNPKVFHGISLILFVLRNLLIYHVITILMYDKWYRFYLAAGVMLIASIHPMHVESVSWMAEIKDVSYAPWYLLAIAFYSIYVRNVQKKQYLVATWVVFIIACLTKGMAVTLPLVLILIDWLFKRDWYHAAIEKIVFIPISGMFGIMAIIIQQAVDVPQPTDFSFQEVYMKMSYALWVYVYKSLVPYPLSAVYPGIFPKDIPVWSSIIPVLVIGFGIMVRKNPIVVFGGVFFLIHITPVLFRGDVGYLQDHYAYVSYVGLYIIIGYTAIQLINSKMFVSRIVSAIVFVWIVGIAYTTYAHTLVWKDEITLFRNVKKHYHDLTSPILRDRARFFLDLEALHLRSQHEFRRSNELYREILEFPMPQNDRFLVHMMIAMNHVSLGEVDSSRIIYEHIMKQGADVYTLQQKLLEQARQNKQTQSHY